MRSKPVVPEVSDALQRRLQAVTEIIAEDAKGRASNDTPPAPAPAPAAPAAMPSAEVVSMPQPAEYRSLRGRLIPPSRQLNVRVPADLFEEVWLLGNSTPGESVTSLVIAALHRELEARKVKPNAAAPEQA